MSEHTKGKLTYSVHADTQEPATLYIVQEGVDIDIADFEQWGGDAEEQKANAEHIKLCWNNYEATARHRDKLLAACNEGLSLLRTHPDYPGFEDCDCGRCTVCTMEAAIEGK